MRFCASMSKCASAYSVGEPGTVKIAADRAPVEEGKINEILAFLSGKLSDADFTTVTDMLDDVVDAAEDLNPTKSMAKDAFPASTRRAIRRGRRDAVLGYDARPARLTAVMAADEAAVKAALPHHGRIGNGGSVGYAAPMPPKPSRPMTAAEKAEASKAFPNMFKGA
ncbi:hypothetical protein ACRAWG_12655 [Methylobacterium sp. P31]